MPDTVGLWVGIGGVHVLLCVCEIEVVQVTDRVSNGELLTEGVEESVSL